MPPELFEIFVTCQAGLEPLLVEELKELGFNEAREGFRGVYAEASLEGIYAINYLSRIGGRVLVPIARFNCFDKRSLYAGAINVDWTKYIPQGMTFAIDVNGQHPDFRNTLFAAQVLKDAICDQFRERTGSRPNVNTAAPDVQLNLFLMKGAALISFDTSGAPLFKRGYRREASEAPIQESLAAAILRIAKYSGEEIILDPCCGSGTFLIEAAYIATKTPAGFHRKAWGFYHFPDFNEEEWQKVKSEADSQRVPLASGKIFGVEVNKDCARICRANLRAAGFFPQISIVQEDFNDHLPSVLPNLIICNPPHGNRLGDANNLIDLYRSLGDFLKHKSAKPAKGFVFTTNLELAKEIGLKPTKRHVIKSSGMDSRLLEFDLF